SPGLLSAPHDLERIVESPEEEDAFFEWHARLAGKILDRRYERLGARGEDEPVIALSHAARRMNELRLAIDRFHSNSGVEGDVISVVPLERVQEDVLRFMRTRENSRKQNAVVIAVGLVAEHHDVKMCAAVSRE